MTRRSSRGFTLIEMVVVLAIIAVLVGIAVPSVVFYLASSKHRAFDMEREKIQEAVDAYYASSDIARPLAEAEYPLIGRSQTGGALTTATTSQSIIDDGDPFDGGSSELRNPIGGTHGMDLAATSTWTDVNGDGVRTISATSTDRWSSVAVTRGGRTFHTDPRYFFVDFEVLVSQRLFMEIPDSVSPDNAPAGSTFDYTGSYIWYVDDDGKVEALFGSFPDSTGFQEGVFP